MKKQSEAAGTLAKARWRVHNGLQPAPLSNRVVKKGRHGPLVLRAVTNEIRAEGVKTPINRPADGQEEDGPVWRAWRWCVRACICVCVCVHACAGLSVDVHKFPSTLLRPSADCLQHLVHIQLSPKSHYVLVCVCVWGGVGGRVRMHVRACVFGTLELLCSRRTCSGLR